MRSILLLMSGTNVRPFFEVHRSVDLKRWEPVGERQRSVAAQDRLGLDVASDGPLAFYRVLTIGPSAANALAGEGAEVFGYGRALTARWSA
jgi:hypothetical protein